MSENNTRALKQVPHRWKEYAMSVFGVLLAEGKREGLKCKRLAISSHERPETHTD
jgi:hypothetical protein